MKHGQRVVLTVLSAGVAGVVAFVAQEAWAARRTNAEGFTVSTEVDLPYIGKRKLKLPIAPDDGKPGSTALELPADVKAAQKRAPFVAAGVAAVVGVVVAVVAGE